MPYVYCTMALPTGTVTFLFTDIENSTKLWEQHPDPMRLLLARHDALLRQTIPDEGGHVFKTVGDAFCAVFADAAQAIATALHLQRSLQAWQEPEMPALRVRMALHTGQAEERDSDYFGPTLNRIARLLAIGHGGQALVSEAVHDAVIAHLPPGVRLRDLQSHRLKDLSQPEHVWQICHPDLAADFPPLRSLAANNLPVQMTSFVGREEALGDVKRLLTQHRLVTLTGPGGAGKTRLALQAAAEIGEADGIWIVDLASLGEKSQVPQALASVLGIREEAGRSLLQTLAETLKTKRMLLIFDNCEHLLEACAGLAQALLSSCPQITILATSRERLGIAGEQLCQVLPMSLPDPNRPQSAQTLRQFESAQLFMGRAASSSPSFSLTDANAPALAQLCHRLDGIPLALELAAARVRSLSVEQINERLDQRFRLLTGGSRTALPRQQTLQNLMDWSYELLTGPERSLLARVSVFSGGWTLAAGEAVCTGVGMDEWEVLDLLASLGDKSLLIYDNERYRLLETVRLYARDRLDAMPDAQAVRERHADYFLALAVETEPKLYGPDQVFWLNTLEADHDNFRTAMVWFITQGDAVRAVRLAGQMGRFWQVRGYLSEGCAALERALALGEASEATPARAYALSSLSILAMARGDIATSLAASEQCLAVWLRLENPSAVAMMRSNLGTILTQQGDFARARAMLKEALAFQEKEKNERALASTLGSLGEVARYEGNYVEAEALAQQSLDLWRKSENLVPVAIQINNLGRIATRQGNTALARAYLREALILRRSLGDQKGLLWSVDATADLTAALGRLAEAAQLYAAAETLSAAQGVTASPVELGERNYFLALVRNGLGVGNFAAAWADGQGLTLDAAVSLALNETGE